MPSPFTSPAVLRLGADFARHQDLLLSLLIPGPLRELDRPIQTTQALGREALQLQRALEELTPLYACPALQDGIDRTAQLTVLTTLAAEHLREAAGIVAEAANMQTPEKGHTQAQLLATQHISFAAQMTSLGADDCLHTARRLARSLDRRHLDLERPAARLSSAQGIALQAIAAGHVTLKSTGDRADVRHQNISVSIATLRALETRDLVQREPSARHLHHECLYPTADGFRALATMLSRPRLTPAPRTRTTPHPTPDARHTTTR